MCFWKSHGNKERFIFAAAKILRFPLGSTEHGFGCNIPNVSQCDFNVTHVSVCFPTWKSLVINQTWGLV